jgi:hypothetical protein
MEESSSKEEQGFYDLFNNDRDPLSSSPEAPPEAAAATGKAGRKPRSPRSKLLVGSVVAVSVTVVALLSLVAAGLTLYLMTSGKYLFIYLFIHLFIYLFIYLFLILIYGQESESALFGFLWDPRHEQFSKAFLGVLKLNTRYET